MYDSIKNEKPVISLKGVSKWYGDFQALKDINLEINPKEKIVICGPSGSGKSTIANAIINLIDPPGEITSGSIKIDNDELRDNEELIQEIRGKKIGFVFQDPQTSLNPLFKIKDQLIETIQTHLDLTNDEAKNKSIDLLKEVGIKDAEKRFNNYPHQFSGGMRQRVVISLALCCEPELLIADEPTTALDVSIQSQILELIKKLTKEVNKATYFPVLESLSFENNKNNDPIIGSNIKDDKIGKFISLKLKMLIKLYPGSKNFLKELMLLWQ